MSGSYHLFTKSRRQLTGVEASDGLILAFGGIPLRNDGRDGAASFARHREMSDVQK